MTLVAVGPGMDPDRELYNAESAAGLARQGWTVLPPSPRTVECLVEGCRVKIADGHRICTFDRRTMGQR